jgi:hypothetical protein
VFSTRHARLLAATSPASTDALPYGDLVPAFGDTARGGIPDCDSPWESSPNVEACSAVRLADILAKAPEYQQTFIEGGKPVKETAIPRSEPRFSTTFGNKFGRFTGEVQLEQQKPSISDNDGTVGITHAGTTCHKYRLDLFARLQVRLSSLSQYLSNSQRQLLLNGTVPNPESCL